MSEEPMTTKPDVALSSPEVGAQAGAQRRTVALNVARLLAWLDRYREKAVGLSRARRSRSGPQAPTKPRR